MKPIEHFVPGTPDEDEGMLCMSRLAWPIVAGVTQAYVEAYTDPADVVLVPYCQGVATVREIVATGRRALAFHYDPALVLTLKAILSPLPARQLDTAVAHLGDSLKQGVPLRHILTGLYATTCPACLRPAVADYFLWDRDQETPVSKYLRCAGCGWEGLAAVGPEDRDRLDEVPERGMHYHYVLDRVAPQPAAGELRARLEPLLKLYSPRNLYALAELTLKIESLFPEGSQRQTLGVLLLDCMDRCSSLHSLPNGAVRAERRGLSRPSRFLERNVWIAFEDAVSRFQRAAQGLSVGLAETLEAFRAPDGGSVSYLGQGLLRDLPHALGSSASEAGPSRGFRLIVTSPPPNDAAIWALSCLWGAWLLGGEAQAVAPLYALLRRRQRAADLLWYAKVMAGALANLGSLLRDEGRLVLVVAGQDPAFVEALLFAANRARLGVTCLVESGPDYRLEVSPMFPQQPTADSSVPYGVQIQRMAAGAAAEAIRARGEPVPWRTVHAAIYRRLASAEGSLLVKAWDADVAGGSPMDLVAEQIRVALDDLAFVRLSGGEALEDQQLWWLSESKDAALPLCDRVETAAHQVLQAASLAGPLACGPGQACPRAERVPLPLTAGGLSEAEFAQAVYERFPGVLTPPASLVSICLRELGQEVTAGRWRLRPEEELAARQAGQQTIVEQLRALGQRLGYQTGAWDSFEAAWWQAGQVRAAFVVRWQAAVSEALALSDRLQGARPYLVIPGGRAALVTYKLAHNPLWQATVDQWGWRFIKYRHVRELAAQPEVDEYTLRTIIGLDPIVERESVQLSLF